MKQYTLMLGLVCLVMHIGYAMEQNKSCPVQDALSKRLLMKPVNGLEIPKYDELCSISQSHAAQYIYVILMIRSGKDIFALDETGTTLLHRAVKWKNEELIKLLIKHGADREIRDCYGLRPINYAVFYEIPVKREKETKKEKCDQP